MSVKFDTLVLTEKPSVARDVVDALGYKVVNRASSRDDGCLLLENGWAVAHLFGHLLETIKPDEYPEGERPHPTNVEPFMPYPLRAVPKPERDAKGKPKMRDGKPVPNEQYKKVIAMMKSAKTIINAGDTDREGQLIVDELLEHAGVDPAGSQKKILRVDLSSNQHDDIRRAFQNPESNGDPRWVRKRLAAQARQFFDFWLGMSVSMALQKLLQRRRASAGRVQSPVCWMVVKRDLDIETFKPVQYYVPVVTLIDGTQMRWYQRKGSEGQPGFDEKGRIVDRRLAQAVVDAINRGQTGTITLADQTKKSEGPPLPFSLADLQVACSKRFGMTLKEVADTAQELYEKRKMISYVGTDCRFLPESKLAEAPGILKKLGDFNAKVAAGANPALKSRAWNDGKIDEHFAIIPMGTVAAGLSDRETKVFDVVMRRYTAQFYPPFQYLKTTLAAMFGEDEFRASARQTVQRGWKEAEGLSEEDEREEDEAAEQQAEAEAELVGHRPR
ncbi:MULTISPECIES: DNA topoisomerase [unclassified Burkholderia]|uniref:DNA topoisomerase n=1 Tax=unclassified Burkholderia TaxID=2613784 RepID=UPI002AB326CA|nr:MULTISPECIES: DNA topoisomerase [unclassified Burkholderia]